MAQFNKMVPTRVGLALLAKAQAGEAKIKITRAVSGDGVWQTDLHEATALNSQKQSFGISRCEVVNDATVNITAIISNENLNEGYYVQEYGIMAAEDGNEEATEILYAILTAVEERADYLPAYNSISPQTITMETLVTVADASEVSILAGTGAYAPADQVNEHEERIGTAEVKINAIETEKENLYRAQGEQIPVDLDQLLDEINVGNFEHAIVGNWLPMVFRGKTYHMSIAGINHFIRGGANDFKNPHILWCADELFETAQKYNDENDNTGGYPASKLYTFVQAMYDDLPAEWKQRVVAAPRVRDLKGANEWNYDDKMILPSEMEVFGCVFNGTPEAERDKKQWPIFFGGDARIIKCLNGQTSRHDWWTSSASAAYATAFVVAGDNGDSYGSYASAENGVPIAFVTSKAQA